MDLDYFLYKFNDFKERSKKIENINFLNFIKLYDNFYYDTNYHIWKITKIENGFNFVDTGLVRKNLIFWNYYIDNDYIVLTYKSMLFYIFPFDEYNLRNYSDDFKREFCGYIVYNLSTDIEFLVYILSKLDYNVRVMYIDKLKIIDDMF